MKRGQKKQRKTPPRGRKGPAARRGGIDPGSGSSGLEVAPPGPAQAVPVPHPAKPDCACPSCESVRRLVEERHASAAAEFERQLRDMGTYLDFAVPLAVSRFDERGLTLSQVLEEAREAGEELAGKGDVLEFGGKGASDAFAALARGLAACSFMPGGVRLAGRHWESKPEWLRREAG